MLENICNTYEIYLTEFYETRKTKNVKSIIVHFLFF